MAEGSAISDGNRSPGLGKAIALALLFLCCLAVIPLLAACEEEEGPTPVTTPVPGTPTLAASPSPAGEVPGVTDTEILLGADCVLSGAAGAIYALIPNTVETYFKYINETQGGVCGRKIVYKVEDNGDDPAKAVEAARKLVEQDKVFAMVGSLGEAPHPAVWEYLNEEGVPDLLISAGGHMYGADPLGHPWTVIMAPSYFIEGTFFGEYISENLPGKKVGVLYPNYPGGEDHLAGVKNGLDLTKNDIVSEQSFEILAVSVASQVNNLANAGAEVVTTNAPLAFVAQAVKQADRLGWHPQWMISYINSDDTLLFKFVSPELLEGTITFQAVKLAGWTDDPAIARHYEIMAEYGGPAPSNLTVYAQLKAELAVEILSHACDNLTRQGVMDAVNSIRDWHSDLLLDEVNVTFSETDHTVLQTGRMLRVTVEDGKGRFEYFGPLYTFGEEGAPQEEG